MRCSGSVAEATKSSYVSSKTSVGLTARSARIEPAPSSNGSAGVTPSSLTTRLRRRGHQRRLDHRRRPVRMRRLDERRDAGRVRARHRGAGDRLVEVAGRAVVGRRLVGLRRHAREHLDAGGGDVRLDEVAERAARRERRHHVGLTPASRLPCAHVAFTFVCAGDERRATRSLGPSRWIAGRQWLSVSTGPA